MTGVFDGMAGVLNGVFGAPVSHIPAGEAAESIDGIFRAEPLEMTDDDGRGILIIAPTLRVPAPVAATIAVGDKIAPGSGKTYLVLNRHPSGSPAVDAFEIFELEDVTDG